MKESNLDNQTELIAELIPACLPERYKIKKQIGEGGMGSVFLAEDLELQRQVAIKILKIEGMQTAESLERFEREAKSLAALSHPHIVKLFSSGIDQNGSPYFVMELLEGISLDQELKKNGKLKPATFYLIFSQILSGLAFMHHNNFIHRDLKPSNIMLCHRDDGQLNAKIIDFGIVRELNKDGQGHTITRSQAILGSPSYLSSEQCRSERGSKMSDIYSLGVIMYECLSGKLPFTGESPLELMYKHMNEAPPKLEAISKTREGKELASIVMQCLEKEPAKRPQSADELLEALNHTAIRLEKQASFEARKPSNTRTILFASTAITAVLVLLNCAWTFLHFKNGPFSSPEQEQISLDKDVKRNKEAIARAEKRLKAAPAGVEHFEAAVDLIAKLQRLGRTLERSNRKSDLEEISSVCQQELAVCKLQDSATFKAKQAAVYDLLADAELKMGNIESSERYFAQCQSIIERIWGIGSREWQDFAIDRCRLRIKQRQFADADLDLSLISEIWLKRGQNPVSFMNASQQLDTEGFLLRDLLSKLHKSLVLAQAKNPEEAADLLSLSNHLARLLGHVNLDELRDLQLRFSKTLLPAIPKTSTELNYQTVELLKKYGLYP